MTPNSSDPAVQLTGVSHHFGKGESRKQVLFQNDLTIGAGEIVIMTGPSGSGKTTLLTLIGALRSVQAGSIKLWGTELAGLSPLEQVKMRRNIGFIFQAHNLFDALSARQNVKMAIELELRYRGLRSPHKLKSAVSGCARECAEARGKDFGVIATENGWNLYVGGNGGTTPRHAELLVSDVDTATLIRTIDRFLMFYVRTADRLQRTAPWIEEMEGGLDHLRAVIVDDSLGICEDLDAAMAKHVDNYADEWKGVLEDPEKLARFTSFVNAPGTPDPAISFREEREQKVPVMLGVPEVRR